MTDSASPLDALKPLAGRALEAALNRALALDPDTRAGLRALDGRSIALHLASPPLAMRILVAGERLEVGPVRSSDEPDLAVRSTLGAIFAQLPNLLGASRATPTWRGACSGGPNASTRTGASLSPPRSARCSECRSPTPSPARCAMPATPPARWPATSPNT